MQIVFCEHCGKRISPRDLESGKCKRDEFAAWCPACTQAVGAAAARPAVAEVAAIPQQPPPQGVVQVSAAQAVAAMRKTGGRASMLNPPASDVLQGRRPTTGAQLRRPTTGKAPLTAPVPQNKPPTGPIKRGPSAVKRTTPAPAAEREASISGQRRFKAEEVQPAKDHTLVFILAGAGLLILGIVVSIVVFKKEDKPAKNAPGKTTVDKTTGEPKTSKTTIPEKTSEPSKTVPAKTVPPKKDDIPVVRPEIEPPKVTDLPADVPKCLVLKPSQLPLLDGQLTEACWKEAKEFEMEFIEGKAGRPSVKSTVRFTATESTLYIGARFDEPDMAQVPLMARLHDENAWADDCLELFLLPGSDAAGVYYQYVVSIGEAVFDAKREGGSTNQALWDAPKDIKFKVHRGSNFWSIELEMPFASIPGAAAQPLMRFNATRNRPKLDTATRAAEFVSWSVLRTSTTHTPARFGVLAFAARGGKLP